MMILLKGITFKDDYAGFFDELLQLRDRNPLDRIPCEIAYSDVGHEFTHSFESFQPSP